MGGGYHVGEPMRVPERILRYPPAILAPTSREQLSKPRVFRGSRQKRDLSLNATPVGRALAGRHHLVGALLGTICAPNPKTEKPALID